MGGRALSTGAPATWNRRLGAGLLLCSLCLSALCLTLVRIFSALVADHFVVTVVSLALVGTAVSGLVVFLAPRRFTGEEAASWMGRASSALTLALLALLGVFLLLSRSPQLARRLLAPLGAGGLAVLDGGSILVLTALTLVSALPFIFGGFVATLALTRCQGRAAQVYACALAGAGLGGVAASALLSWLDPFRALAALALVAALASWLFFKEGGSRAGALGALTLGALSFALVAATARAGVTELKFVDGRYQPEPRLTRRDSRSRVSIRPLPTGEGEAARGVSARFGGAIPEQYGVAVDDTGGFSVARYRFGDDLGWARAHLLALPYLARDEAQALIMGAGGGTEILIALAGGADAVRAVEPDPQVVRAVQDDFGDFSGRPYTLAGVELAADAGRTFLARDSSVYDVIHARLSPAGGPFTSPGDHLATIEAFHAFLDRLSPRGVLAFSAFNGEKSLLRLVATARAALEARGSARPSECVFVAAEGSLVTVLVANVPFLAEELELLRRHCRELGFPVLYTPGDDVENPITWLLRVTDSGAYLAALPFDASPVDDDRPYFTAQVRRGDVLRPGGSRPPGFEERWLPTMRNLLLALLGLGILCTAVPLARSGRPLALRRGRFWMSAGYFAAIGVGFSAVAIGLFKRFTLLLGQPVSAQGATLAVFLAAGAIGSARSGRMSGNGRLVRRSCARLTIVLLFTAVLLPLLIEMLLPAPQWARTIATVAVTGGLGFLLGRLLPAGLSLVRDQRLLPWACSVNGAFSVFGLAGALVIAVIFGHTTMMLVGPASYLVAGVLAELIE